MFPLLERVCSSSPRSTTVVIKPQRIKRVIFVLSLPALLAASFFGFTSTWAAVLLGPITFSEIPARPLEYHSGSVEIETMDCAFLEKGGGVSFGAIAQPKDGITVEKLEYRHTAPDGERLVVYLRTSKGSNTTVKAKLFDWQLLPIANLAMDTDDGLVTLFGKLVDSRKTEEVRRRKDFIANLHPHLTDTLLGLRLIQADMLMLSGGGDQVKMERLGQDVCCDLPSENEYYLLGEGEVVPNWAANKLNYERVRQTVQDLEETSGPFRSYLISDHGQVIHFSGSNGHLVFEGYPHWNYWRLPSDYHKSFDWQWALERKASELPETALEQLRVEYAQDQKKLQPSDLMLKYTESYRRSRITEIFEGLWKSKSILLFATGETPLEAKPIWLHEWKSKVSEGIREADGINPAVYQALLNTMHYRAFFRHVRSTAPKAYSNFMQSLPDMSTVKTVTTPSVISLGGGAN